MCVERKTVHDFESSIINSRLFDQLDRLSRDFKKPILLLEGNDAEFTMHKNVVLGAILSIYGDFNVQVIRSDDVFDTVTILARFAEREQEGKEREPRIVGSKRAFTSAQWQVVILSSIPGIGPKLAVSLIRHFKTLKSVLSADPKDLMEVEKVGKKKAERIYEIINSEFTEG
jgi:ERCC4-type nuclease